MCAIHSPPKKSRSGLKRPPGLLAESWIRTNAQFFTALAAQTMSSVLIRVFVALTVALGIASVLVVSVVQKSKEIGILRAMGTTRGWIRRCAAALKN